MGRYYSGDIEGKFWFGVQPSDDAEFFGGYSSLEYQFEESDLDSIQEGIAECEKELGGYKDKLDKFFEGVEKGYDDEMIMKALKIDKKQVLNLLSWYARLELGEKILKCVKEKGGCSFSAEL